MVIFFYIVLGKMNFLSKHVTTTTKEKKKSKTEMKIQIRKLNPLLSD